MSAATQSPTSPNSASGGHEKPLPGTARALPRKVENRTKSANPTQLLAYHRTTGVPLRYRIATTAVCCRCGLVGTCCSTAAVVLLLYCCDGGAVDGWVVGGGCLVGGGSLAIHEMLTCFKFHLIFPLYIHCYSFLVLTCLEFHLSFHYTSTAVRFSPHSLSSALPIPVADHLPFPKMAHRLRFYCELFVAFSSYTSLV